MDNNSRYQGIGMTPPTPGAQNAPYTSSPGMANAHPATIEPTFETEPARDGTGLALGLLLSLLTWAIIIGTYFLVRALHG